MAASLVAISSTMGMGPAVGMAMAIGLLPTTASAPPGAGISGRIAGHDADAIGLSGLKREAPRRAEMKTVPYRHNTDAELPGALDRDGDGLIAGEVADRWRASRTTAAPLSDTITPDVSEDTQPCCMRSIYMSVSMTPCDGMPSRSASVKTFGNCLRGVFRQSGGNEQARHEFAELFGRNAV